MSTIVTDSGLALDVNVRAGDSEIEICVETKAEPQCLLHWGLTSSPGAGWKLPPEERLPIGTQPIGRAAAETPFVKRNGRSALCLTVPSSPRTRFLEFALRYPDGSRWDSNRGRNYRIEIPHPEPAGPSPTEALAEKAAGGELTLARTYSLGDRCELAVGIVADASGRRSLWLLTNLEGAVVLHWGVTGANRRDWLLPPPPMRPSASSVFDERALRTAFGRESDLLVLEVPLLEVDSPQGVSFVLTDEASGEWWKHGGGNFFVSVRPRPAEGAPEDPKAKEIAEDIIWRETEEPSWTLMHRFHLCTELLDGLPNDHEQGMALLFVWLRFSAIRQLDWQRQYNTKPRDLSHAENRLTLKIAERYARASRTRPMLRMMASTLGRGGDGQRIRDEILNIMHRHRIKETSGHFLEEWHQKLHNNTTPDDVVICRAYLEFLRSNGRLDAFYGTLETGGVDRQRLASYERPIRTAPDFVPALRNALIEEFERYLETLKSVHAATDLGRDIASARRHLDTETQGLLDVIWADRHAADPIGSRLFARITRARMNLESRFGGGAEAVRDLLYLDIALEDFLRSVVERSIHVPRSPDHLFSSTELALDNLGLTRPSAELSRCREHLGRLASGPRSGATFGLHGQAVLERMRRELAARTDDQYRLLQPAAEYLGRALGAAPWTIELFSEEMLRGGLEFAVSALFRKFDASLRQLAGVGKWQVVSRGRGTVSGRLEVVGPMRSVQGRTFYAATIIVADEVAGDEDVPEGVQAILTTSTIDLVSHVAVRARNAGVVFATCYEPSILDQIRALRGEQARLCVTPAGEVEVERGTVTPEQTAPVSLRAHAFKAPPPFSGYAVGAAELVGSRVGAKSRNLRRLHGLIPDWIRLPPSVALPFGVFGAVLRHPRNRSVAERYAALVAQTGSAPEEALPSLLEALRAEVTRLEAPDELFSALREVMRETAIPEPSSWGEAFRCISKVWASKWNQRAYYSRRANQFPDESLDVAVLVQQVVPAEYAFVIHTVDPSTRNRDEIYAEVVLGLGETLVGNYPGRALGFRMHKHSRAITLTSFPSKSTGLYGGGLFFRSDSNGEDLGGFAGAGLYDSIALPEPRTVPLHYVEERLLWDEPYRAGVLRAVGEIGAALEQTLGAPQDIEGACADGQYYVVQARPQVGLEDGS